MFQTVFTPYLQTNPLIYKDKKQPFCRVGYNYFTFFTIADNSPSLISHRKSKSLGFTKKNIPHLYEFLRGYWQPFLDGFQEILSPSPNRTKNWQKSPLEVTDLQSVYKIQ